MNTNNTNQNDSELADTLTTIEKLSPDFASYLNNLVSYHKERHHILSTAERESIIIASLITQGSPKRPLQIHIKKALAAGLTQEKLIEVVLQTSLYSGMPTATSALLTLDEVFSKTNSGRRFEHSNK